MAETEAKFPVSFPSDTSGLKGAQTELQKLRQDISAGSDSLKNIAEEMQRLSGLDEIKAFTNLKKNLGMAEAEVGKLNAKLDKLNAQRAMPGLKEGQIAKLDAEIARTQEQLKGATGEVTRIKGKLDELGKTDAVKMFNDLGTKQAKLKQDLAQSQLALTKMGGSLKTAATGALDFNRAIAGVSASTEVAREKWSASRSVAELFGVSGEGVGSAFSMGAVAIAGATVAILAFGVAAAFVIAKVVQFAFTMADAARSARLLREAAFGSAAGADAAEASVDRVRKYVAMTREELFGLSLDLKRAGHSGQQLEDTMSAVAIVSKTMGEGAAGKLRSIIDRGLISKRFVLNPLDLLGTGIEFNDVVKKLSQLTGKTMGTAGQEFRNGSYLLKDGVRLLNEVAKDRFGDVARRQMLSLPNIFARAKENIGRLFEGIGIEKFLTALDKVVGLLDQSTDFGKALKQMLTSLFQPLADSAEAVLPDIEIMMWNALGAFARFMTSMQKSGGLKKFFTEVQVTARDLLDTVRTLAGLVKDIADAYKFLKGPSHKQEVVREDAFQKEKRLIDQGLAKPRTDAEIRAAIATGENLSKGIAEGVKAGQPVAVGAMTDLAKVMREAFETANQIHSPSDLYRDIAYNIPAGASMGVDDGAPLVNRSIAKMADPGAMGASSATISGGGVQIVIHQLNVGVGKAREAADEFIDTVRNRMTAAGVA